MKAVILAGGLGTRLAEETDLKPKPMVEVGGMPLIWHIMKIYTAYGITDFIICCGYKGYVIKEYFSNYFLHANDVTIDMVRNTTIVHKQRVEPWKITLIDTGLTTQTGGRLKQASEYLDSTFCFTYGDGVGDIDIRNLVDFHRSSKTLATVTAVRPPGRYGSLDIADSKVTSFIEKPKGDGNWISGGFFVLEPEVLNYIENDQMPWERDPLKKLVVDNQLSAYQHDSFWRPMDTLRDKRLLEDLWHNNSAPWKIW